MTVKIYFTDAYTDDLKKIENFIFESTENVKVVEQFFKEHDEVLEFVRENPNTPAVHPKTGDQSWIFSNGRYRLFFNTIKSSSILKIYLTQVIDNREANLEVYPNNSVPTYDED